MIALATIVLTTAILTASSGVSTDMAEEFERIAKAHRDLARYDVIIRVRYEGEGAVAPILAEVKCIDFARCIRSIGPITVLQTPVWSIAVDQSRKSMTIAHRNANLPATSSYQDPHTLLSAWLKTGAKVSGGEITADGQHWTFLPASARQMRADVYTDPRTHLIRRLTYQADAERANAGSVDVSYAWNDPSQLSPGDFDEAKYIMEQGDVVSPARGYDNYSLVRTDRH
jgi:hypothetical protein